MKNFLSFFFTPGFFFKVPSWKTSFKVGALIFSFFFLFIILQYILSSRAFYESLESGGIFAIFDGNLMYQMFIFFGIPAFIFLSLSYYGVRFIRNVSFLDYVLIMLFPAVFYVPFIREKYEFGGVATLFIIISLISSFVTILYTYSKNDTIQGKNHNFWKILCITFLTLLGILGGLGFFIYLVLLGVSGV